MDKKKEEQETKIKGKIRGNMGHKHKEKQRMRERWFSNFAQAKKWSPRDQDEESSEDKYKLSTLPKK